MFYSVVHPTNRKQVSLEASGGSENMCLKLATKCLLSHKKVEINFGNHWTSKIVTHHKWVEIKCNSMMP